MPKRSTPFLAPAIGVIVLSGCYEDGVAETGGQGPSESERGSVSTDGSAGWSSASDSTTGGGSVSSGTGTETGGTATSTPDSGATTGTEASEETTAASTDDDGSGSSTAGSDAATESDSGDDDGSTTSSSASGDDDSTSSDGTTDVSTDTDETSGSTSESSSSTATGDDDSDTSSSDSSSSGTDGDSSDTSSDPEPGTHLLQYKPATGALKIVTLAPDEWASDDLGQERLNEAFGRELAFTAFELDDRQYLLQYHGSGMTRIIETSAASWDTGSLGTEVYQKMWTSGWEHDFFRIGSASYVLHYNSSNGEAKIVELERNQWSMNDLGTTVYEKSWSEDWVQLPLEVAGGVALLQYKPNDGEAKIVELDPGQWPSNDLGTLAYEKNWSQGWDSMAWMMASKAYLLQYKPDGGDAKIVELIPSQWPDDDLGTERYANDWTDGWVNTALEIGVESYLLQYKPTAGDVKIVELDPSEWADDDLGTERYRKTWTTGWVNTAIVTQ